MTEEMETEEVCRLDLESLELLFGDDDKSPKKLMAVFVGDLGSKMDLGLMWRIRIFQICDEIINLGDGTCTVKRGWIWLDLGGLREKYSVSYKRVI